MGSILQNFSGLKYIIDCCKHMIGPYILTNLNQWLIYIRVVFLLAVDQSETKIQISGAIHLVNLRTPLKVYLIPLFMIILVPLDKVLNL